MSEASASSVNVAVDGPICVVSINRPQVRNCVNRPTAEALADAFRAFEADEAQKVAILTGVGDHFCAGADLKAIASGEAERANHIQPEGDGPMGPSRMMLSKPVIAAVSGYCVAGGIELALWCDLRVADETAIFGVFCRRFGVPLIDGGTVRLPRMIGMSHALDMILTGRPVHADEAKQMGLANRVTPAGNALNEAKKLASALCEFPQTCMRGDRSSAYEQWGMSQDAAIANEFQHGLGTLASGETVSGASRFSKGVGRHGEFGGQD
ncbi:MAG: crotonase/enoyl-CoA hydratase family protein [Panacagrimonas sp.]